MKLFNFLTFLFKKNQPVKPVKEKILLNDNSWDDVTSEGYKKHNSHVYKAKRSKRSVKRIKYPRATAVNFPLVTINRSGDIGSIYFNKYFTAKFVKTHDNPSLVKFHYSEKNKVLIFEFHNSFDSILSYKVTSTDKTNKYKTCHAGSFLKFHGLIVKGAFIPKLITIPGFAQKQWVVYLDKPISPGNEKGWHKTKY